MPPAGLVFPHKTRQALSGSQVGKKGLMDMKKIATIFLAGALAISSSLPASAQVQGCRTGCGGGTNSGVAWWILACPAGVMTAAMVKNWKRHKELNAPEAWTCGLLYWWNEATGQYGR